MTMKLKVTICWIALILSTLFLIIGVDSLPYIVCWLPLIIVGYAVAQCKEFKESFNRLADHIMPE